MVTEITTDRKIKRLEKKIDSLKWDIEDKETHINNLKQSLTWEREWRINFQKLLKDAVHDDTLDVDTY